MYERKTQPMIKKSLLLLPLLVACTSSSINDGYKLHDYNNDDVYYNVDYSFDFDNHCYRVGFTNKDREYTINNVPLKNCYEIRVENYYRINNSPIYNEYFIKVNELFVYYKA